ncbi:MFS transporter [Vibrio aquimaris]|uniref:Multidrug resistance protein stp n=1 Tax=Vibrio aquimaris TaxID=2587862 RepID=A0A5P9CHC5_9VIBR|nr:MFS transporter [Vibrio aquimaris]QFT25634.1 Multidrug resistance protein stp [Vibrio aquimaris]
MLNTIPPTNRVALAAVCLSTLMLALEITSVPSILPTLEDLLPANFRELQWIMDAYTLATCSVLIAMGSIGDRFGRKRVFMVGILVFAIASLLCGMATSAPILIAARFLQGLSAAAMLASQVAILSHQFPDGSERGTAFSIWGVVLGLGLGFGPLFGGVVLEYASWEWVFLIHVFISVVTLVLAKKGVVESSNPTANKLDIGGMLTLSISVLGFVYLIIESHAINISSNLGLSILLSSILSLTLFVIIENKVQQPMFDFSAFKIRSFSGALLGSSGMNFSFWPFLIYFPIYLQSVLDYSGIESGLIILALTIPTILVPPYAESMLLRRGAGFVIPAGLFTISLGFAAIWLAVQTPYPSWVTLVPSCTIAGIGLGLVNSPATNTATISLPPKQAGLASGMDLSARMISLAINIALMGYVFIKGITEEIQKSSSLGNIKISSIASEMASGDFSVVRMMGFSKEAINEIMTTGFSWVTLYASISALVICIAAALLFERQNNNSLKY